MNQMTSDSFLLICKQNRIANITPSGERSYLTDGYKAAVEIAKEYFSRGEYKEFSEFFQEGQYLIPLWTAHMLLEYGTPPPYLIRNAIDVVERYSDNPLAPDVASEEKEWIKQNYDKYRTYFT